jgi:hypothetical protein
MRSRRVDDTRARKLKRSCVPSSTCAELLGVRGVVGQEAALDDAVEVEAEGRGRAAGVAH